MWPEVQSALASFPDVVLTGRDREGNPVSVRGRPRPDAGLLRIARLPGIEIVGGPASLLGHSHDENLWTLRSVLVRGMLTLDGPDWVVRPTALVPGTGMRGPVQDLRSFVGARRRAGRYLRRRGLARPSIPWTRLRALR